MMMVSVKGAHVPQEIILPCVRWYVVYPVCTRHVEALMRARGVPVDHATVNRWGLKYSHPWKRCSTLTNAPSGSAGGWMKRPFGSQVNGAIAIARWTRRARRLISS